MKSTTLPPYLIDTPITAPSVLFCSAHSQHVRLGSSNGRNYSYINISSPKLHTHENTSCRLFARLPSASGLAQFTSAPCARHPKTPKVSPRLQASNRRRLEDSAASGLQCVEIVVGCRRHSLHDDTTARVLSYIAQRGRKGNVRGYTQTGEGEGRMYELGVAT